LKTGHIEEGDLPGYLESKSDSGGPEMANRLSMAFTLREQGLSNRKIGEVAGIHRETVGRYLKGADLKPAKAPTGEEGASGGSPSQCEPHRVFIG
jgi:hypothetical protein